eukprot:TRINITY_DN8132_c0_g1_i2.p1 TRINITY_DN8132_c0_g1~~TRINITY_DN8132_c0_g1_i2.p1  ORF type:complete len:235 (+),score=10.39 TRINITY_DN8132_c0_g1_i2:59-706(+)
MLYTPRANGPRSTPSELDRLGIFAGLSPRYDKEMESEEYWSGILARRQRLVSQARGQILEVGCGTGRNLGFYPALNTKLVLCDWSRDMVTCALEKARRLPAETRPSEIKGVVANAHQLPFESGTFDTVVDTFGLCSFSEPVAALHEMARVCRPDGQILLLEHGRSQTPMIGALLNWYLDMRAPGHLCDWGCWWNLDISELVRQSGLGLSWGGHHI